MTTLITTTPKHLLVVGIDGDQYNFAIEENKLLYSRMSKICVVNRLAIYIGQQELPPGKWKIVFIWSERTEEKAAKLLPFKPALDALESLFESEKLFTENPFGKEPPFIFCSQIDSEEVIKMRQDKSDKEWHLAQSLVHEDYIILVEEGEG